MNESYVFSYYKPEKIPVLVRRPWYNIFGKDSIKFRFSNTRECIDNITKAEADMIAGPYPNALVISLITKILKKSTYWQLERGNKTTSAYIAKNRKEDNEHSRNPSK